MSDLARAIATDAYEDVAGLLKSIVYRFVQQYGGEWREMLAEANLMFMHAHDSYDPDISEFNTWLYNTVWNGLQRQRIKETTYKIRHGLPIPLDATACNGKPLDKLIDGLSDDARTIVGMTLDNPELPKHIVYARMYLKAAALNLGWTLGQYKRAFREIKELL